MVKYISLHFSIRIRLQKSEYKTLEKMCKSDMKVSFIILDSRCTSKYAFFSTKKC